MAVSGFSFRNALVASGWATAALLCINGLRKQSSYLALHAFWAGSFFPSLGKWLLDECCNYCKLVDGWV